MGEAIKIVPDFSHGYTEFRKSIEPELAAARRPEVPIGPVVREEAAALRPAWHETGEPKPVRGVPVSEFLRSAEQAIFREQTKFAHREPKRFKRPTRKFVTRAR